MKQAQKAGLSIQYANLPDGTSSRHELCPFCKGGSSGEKSFKVYRYGAKLTGKCFRAGCGAGVLISNNSQEELQTDAHVRKRPKLTIMPLPYQAYDILYKLVGLTKEQLDREQVGFDPNSNRIVYSSFNDAGDVMAYQARKYSELGDDGKKQKVITYPMVDKLGWAYPRNRHENSDLFLVEDMPSAIRLSEYVPTAALLGTYIDREEAARHAKMGIRRLYIALDEDATNKAYHYAEKLSTLFYTVTVIKLDKDIKNCSNTEIEGILNEQAKQAFIGAATRS